MGSHCFPRFPFQVMTVSSAGSCCSTVMLSVLIAALGMLMVDMFAWPFLSSSLVSSGPQFSGVALLLPLLQHVLLAPKDSFTAYPFSITFLNEVPTQRPILLKTFPNSSMKLGKQLFSSLRITLWIVWVWPRGSNSGGSASRPSWFSGGCCKTPRLSHMKSCSCTMLCPSLWHTHCCTSTVWPSKHDNHRHSVTSWGCTHCCKSAAGWSQQLKHWASVQPNTVLLANQLFIADDKLELKDTQVKMAIPGSITHFNTALAQLSLQADTPHRKTGS